MAGYLTRLATALKAADIACPLFLMMSGGGLTTLETAIRLPIRLVESGPAGGAILAGGVARRSELGEVLSFDMGGTTAKICLIAGGEPQRARVFEVARMYRDLKGSGLPVRIPVIEMVEIGAGGGSIARVDSLRRVTVGPDSAGAEPGPACYGRGGDRPAVTDGNLVLGRLDPALFAGGKINLNTAAAASALDRDIGAPLGLSTAWSAAAVSEIVEENMANAARVHAIERGKVIGRHTMIAFGGGAPAHAARVADKLGITTVLVPSGAGVGSAIGFLQAPVSYQVVRSRRTTLAGFDLEEINGLLESMRDEATAVVRRGAGDAPLLEARQADMRYVGQGHELAVDVPARRLSVDDLPTLLQSFEAMYRQAYGLTIPDLDVEALTWSVTVSTHPVQPPIAPAEAAAQAATPFAERPLFDREKGEHRPVPLYRRADLRPGATLTGPAIIAEDETTTLVPGSWRVRVDPSDTIVMTKQADG